jgi:septation ring formation regulator EzrA
MEDIHKYLDETKKNLNELVSEINKVKSLRLLNEKTTNSLVAMQNTLEAVERKIKPFQSVAIKKIMYIFLGISIVNLLMVAVLLVFTIMK